MQHRPGRHFHGLAVFSFSADKPQPRNMKAVSVCSRARVD